MTAKTSQIQTLSRTEKIGLSIAFFAVLALFPTVGMADTLYYSTSEVTYSPATAYNDHTRFAISSSKISNTPSSVSYGPSVSRYSVSQNSGNSSRLSSSYSQVASVASSISYSPSTAFRPQVKRTVALKQTASVINALPQLPKTGGGGRAKLADRLKI